jgi:hypothetical protein
MASGTMREHNSHCGNATKAVKARNIPGGTTPASALHSRILTTRIAHGGDRSSKHMGDRYQRCGEPRGCRGRNLEHCLSPTPNCRLCAAILEHPARPKVNATVPNGRPLSRRAHTAPSEIHAILSSNGLRPIGRRARVRVRPVPLGQTRDTRGPRCDPAGAGSF